MCLTSKSDGSRTMGTFCQAEAADLFCLQNRLYIRYEHLPHKQHDTS
jgi:hypothetical protein